MEPSQMKKQKIDKESLENLARRVYLFFVVDLGISPFSHSY
jgi:hypothetical protein